jgi:hypothetical protein
MKSFEYLNDEFNNAFKALNLNPTLDKQLIIKAWRKAASKCHPDLFINPDDKEKSHKKFIKLGQARDICLRITELDLEGFNDSNKDSYENTKDKNEESSGYPIEEEWKIFINNKNILLSFYEAIFISLVPLIKLFIFSYIYPGLFLIIGFLLFLAFTDLFTTHIQINTIGWIVGLSFFVIILFKLYSFKLHISEYFLNKLSLTGYPFSFFLLIWFVHNFIYFFLFLYFGKVLSYFFLLGNLGMYFIFNELKENLLNIEEGLDSLRNGKKNKWII